MVRASETNACDTRIRAAKVTRHFSFPSLKTRGASVPRRFKQRKERSPLQARLFSSNAIPYASITLPRCRRCLSFTLSLFFFLCTLVFFIFLGCLLPCLPPSLPSCVSFPRDSPLMPIFPYRLIRKKASLPSLCMGFSFISLFLLFDPFFIRRANPPSPLTRYSALAVSPLSMWSLQLLLLISLHSTWVILKHSIPFLDLD